MHFDVMVRCMLQNIAQKWCQFSKSAHVHLCSVVVRPESAFMYLAAALVQLFVSVLIHIILSTLAISLAASLLQR